MKVLDHGYCKIAEPENENVWGSDEGIVAAARMSTSGSFRGWDLDERLLRYLWKHKHYSPFELAGMVIEVQAPIFVTREWFRHRTQSIPDDTFSGDDSYNELSARYVELPNLYYIPTIERIMAGKQSTTNKQGSEAGWTAMEAELAQNELRITIEVMRKIYEELLAMGMARELARLVIPVSQYTRFRASANLRNWLAFLSLRLDPTTQWEMREFAKAVAGLVEERFPRTWTLFNEERT